MSLLYLEIKSAHLTSVVLSFFMSYSQQGAGSLWKMPQRLWSHLTTVQQTVSHPQLCPPAPQQKGVLLDWHLGTVQDIRAYSTQRHCRQSLRWLKLCDAVHHITGAYMPKGFGLLLGEWMIREQLNRFAWWSGQRVCNSFQKHSRNSFCVVEGAPVEREVELNQSWIQLECAPHRTPV